jgi:four helix bundle protein
MNSDDKTNGMFGHERFEAYQLSIQFLKLTLDLVEKIPPGYSAVKDQLKRASLSIPLNIAEGSGKRQIPDRNRFYGIARGSAMECAAICDVLSLLDEGFAGKTDRGKLMLRSIVSILTTVCSRDRDQV